MPGHIGVYNLQAQLAGCWVWAELAEQGRGESVRVSACMFGTYDVTLKEEEEEEEEEEAKKKSTL